ncbi:hypothetical protein [Hymenobacter metallicola]|uniref:Uncharacterized protein n=1 Tax=Hymenobacter metallicola TaxID=2563114 RepID=A0A4Z0QA91_9BACT|nr:hypothetical protein [Hymenobacter metallicola]TGE26376.1 hypothetical protein E5K02_16395 [Hymenobacter metallicola]
MHLTSSFRLLPALALGLLLLPGCYSRKDIKEEGGAETPTEVPPTEAPGAVAPKETTAAAATPAPAGSGPLAQVNVFLEVSGSMEGFMPKTGADASNTRFQQHVAQFLSEVNRSSAARKTFLRIKEKPYRDSYQQLSQTVRGGIQQPASSTDIPTVLDTLVANYYAPNSVSVLISDFIYSPKNAGAIPYISTDITDALNRAQRPDLAVSVYGYSSDFRGTYYPALKTAMKRINSCCDTDIPYYFWVIGPADAVRRFDTALLEKQPAQQAHFGVTYPVPTSSLLSRFQNVGSWYYGEKDASKRAAGATYHTVAVSSVSAKEPVEFVVGLDLKQLPGLFRDVKYLKPNLQLQAQDTDAKIIDVFAANDQTKNSSGAESQYTHFVKVRVTKLGKAARPLQLVLKNQRPAWVGQWTTKNDSNINQVGAKTFALSSLLDGVEAVTTSGQEKAPVFTIPLTLQPAD